MSSAILQGGASGSGSMTLLAPNTNSNQTITVPDVTATMMTNKTTGTVLQVVQTMTNGDQTFAATGSGTPGSATWVAVSGVNVSITPSSASNKILVSVTFKACGNTGSNSPGNAYWGGRVTYSIAGGSYSVVPPVGAARVGSVPAHFNVSPDRADGSQYRMTSCNTIELLHSPNTTSSINYRLEVAGFLDYLILGRPNINGSDENYWTEPYGITVMEIAG